MKSTKRSPEMGMSCGAKCAKGLLVVFNILFWVSGCFLFAVGVYFLIDKEKAILFHFFTLPELGYALTQYLAWAFVGVGGLVFLVGFCGCCAAVRENRCLLVTYFLFLFLIMGAELAVGILSVLFHSQTISQLEDLSVRLKDEYGIDSQTTEAFDYAQTKFNCCGIFGPEDYDESAWKSQDLGKGANVAKTCCILQNNDHLEPKPLNDSMCQSDKPNENVVFRNSEGCIFKIEEFVKHSSKIFAIIGCGMAVLQIFGMVFAMCLCKEV